MSGIAEVLLTLGYEISGSDIAKNSAIERLVGLGATIQLGHRSENISNADVVVVSTAVGSDNPELIYARARRTPIVPRALMLAELMRLKHGIAIAGTHGKTTTTSLVASVLAEGGLDPTFVVGGRVNAAGTNAKLGSGDFIVVEADESDASFLHLQPVVAVVTNIDADHMDTYGHDIARLKQTFIQFLQNLPFYGSAILCIEDPNVREILPFITKPVTTYGFSREAMVRAENVRHDAGRMRFHALRNRREPLDVVLSLPGEHNVLNALAAIAIATELGIHDEGILRALSGFKGVTRRFQSWGELPARADIGQRKGKFTLIDDYGHHPAEIAAVVNAARGAYPGHRIVLSFQPHRYTRTRDLFEDFVRALSMADALVLSEVYPAGETPIVAADGRSLARAVRVAGAIEPVFVDGIAQMAEAIYRIARSGDVVLTMGAGSIGSVAQELASLSETYGKVSND
jgi:UDP-N-acetylmuramate--alanine ligase